MAGFIDMAVTPNYGWPVPVATDYVKDGYAAIADLGDAIDATVFALPAGSLALVKSQVVGSAVASVTVTDAFSATYDNYLISYSGGVGSVAGYIRTQLAVGGTVTATAYYEGANYANYAGGGGYIVNNNTTSWENLGFVQSTLAIMNIDLLSPYLAKKTSVQFSTPADSLAYAGAGYQNSLTQFDSFKIFPQSGTLTGGTIRVYGYQNS
jgi:hypothetical protein